MWLDIDQPKRHFAGSFRNIESSRVWNRFIFFCYPILNFDVIRRAYLSYRAEDQSCETKENVKGWSLMRAVDGGYIYITCLYGGEVRNNQPDLQMKKHAHVVTWIAFIDGEISRAQYWAPAPRIDDRLAAKLRSSLCASTNNRAYSQKISLKLH
jgi:hypothetical protein